MKTLLPLITVFLLLTGRSFADAAASIQRGLGQIKSHNISAANLSFKEAATLEPGNAKANLLYAVTRIVVLNADPAVQALMDKMGMPKAGRDLFNWTSEPPAQFPLGSTLQSGDYFKILSTVLLPELRLAEGNLAKITDTGFVTTIYGVETGLDDVVVDYGDVRFLRALVQSVICMGEVLSTFNFEVSLGGMADWLENTGTTMERLLVTYPNLFGVKDGTRLLPAVTAYRSMVDHYSAAAEFILGRPEELTDSLFQIDEGKRAQEAAMRERLVEVRDSFDRVVPLTQRIDLHAGAFLPPPGGAVRSLRSLLPLFSGNRARPGSFPDATFNGVLPSAPRDEAEAVLPKISEALARLFRDYKPPQVVSFDFTPRTVNVSTTSKQVTITARLKDLASGVDPTSVKCSFNLIISDPEYGYSYFSGAGVQATLTRSAGTANDGTYTGKVTIPRYAVAGAWGVQFECQDTAQGVTSHNPFIYEPFRTGNFLYVDAVYPFSEKLPAGAPTTLTVQSSLEDTDGPAVSASASSSGMDVSETSDALTIEANVTDNLSGVASVVVEIQTPSDPDLWWMWTPPNTRTLPMTRTSGTQMDGSYQLEVPIPRYAAAGSWSFTVRATDNAGNTGSQYLSLDVQSSQSDYNPPQVRCAFYPGTISVVSAAKDVVVNLRISDDLSGVDAAKLSGFLESPSRNSKLPVVFTRVRGDDADGTYSATVTMAKGAELGDWTFTLVAPDLAGNGGAPVRLPNLLTVQAVDQLPPDVLLTTPVPGSSLPGVANAPLRLAGTATDDFFVSEVALRFNGGPWIAATLQSNSDRRLVQWEVPEVIPENGINIVEVQGVDNYENSTPLKTFSFNYALLRESLAGNYAGLATPTAASTDHPARHVGLIGLNVGRTGVFSGKLNLGGSASPVVLRGTIGSAGDARFGTNGASTLEIQPPGSPTPVPLRLALTIDVNADGPHQITGTLLEQEDEVSTITLDQAPYSVTNPFGGPGAYTGVFKLIGTQDVRQSSGLSASDYPQGNGWALVTVTKTGKVSLAGSLADGQAFSYANNLSLGGVLPLYLPLYRGAGSLSGPVTFRDVEGESDADGLDLLWFKPENSRDSAYRSGWADGIKVDFLGSKFLSPYLKSSPLFGKTLLGNDPASVPATNALLGFSDGLGVDLSNDLAVTLSGAVSILNRPDDDLRRSIKLSRNGKISGSFKYPPSGRTVLFNGVIFQKQQSAAGYFLTQPDSVSVPGALLGGAVTISPQ